YRVCLSVQVSTDRHSTTSPTGPPPRPPSLSPDRAYWSPWERPWRSPSRVDLEGVRSGFRDRPPRSKNLTCPLVLCPFSLLFLDRASQIDPSLYFPPTTRRLSTHERIAAWRVGLTCCRIWHGRFEKRAAGPDREFRDCCIMGCSSERLGQPGDASERRM